MAEARVLRRGKEIVYADVDVRNDAGKPIAKGLVTWRAVDRAAPREDRQRIARATPPVAGNDDVPPLARAIVSVPFIKSLGMRIDRMVDGHAVLHMPFTPEKRDHAGAVHEGALAALLDTTGAMASWSITGIDFRYKASTVGKVEYSLDAQKWIRLVPVDGIADSSDETYKLRRADVAGKFVIVRAVDAFYNVATQSVTP